MIEQYNYDMLTFVFIGISIGWFYGFLMRNLCDFTINIICRFVSKKWQDEWQMDIDYNNIRIKKIEQKLDKWEKMQ